MCGVLQLVLAFLGTAIPRMYISHAAHNPLKPVFVFDFLDIGLWFLHLGKTVESNMAEHNIRRYRFSSLLRNLIDE